MDEPGAEERAPRPAGSNQSNSGEDAPARTGAKASAVVTRLVKARVPLPLVLIGVVVAVILLLGSLLSRESVDLGPGVDGAVDAQLSLTVCNEVVDQRGFNPRTAEIDAERGLRDLGVKQVKVALARIDCGPDTPATEPAN